MAGWVDRGCKRKSHVLPQPVVTLFAEPQGGPVSSQSCDEHPVVGVDVIPQPRANIGTRERRPDDPSRFQGMAPTPNGLDGEELGVFLARSSQVVANQLIGHFCCLRDERLCREAPFQVRYLDQTGSARSNGLPHGAGWAVAAAHPAFFILWMRRWKFKRKVGIVVRVR